MPHRPDHHASLLVTVSFGLWATACLPQPSGTPTDPGGADASMQDAGSGMDASPTSDAGPELDANTDEDMARDAGADDMSLEDLGAGDMTKGEDMPVDMPPLPPATVPVLVGTGDFGRRIISCDGGQSWQESASFLGGSQYCMDADDSPVCYPGDGGTCSFTARDGSCKKSDNCDCDHSSGTPLGLTFAGDEQGGHFVGVYGWGNVVTTFVRSDDGITWTEQEGVVNTPAGVAYGDGVVMLGTKKGWHSTDGGESWSEAGSFDIVHSATGENVFNTRKTMYVPTDGGRFFISASSGKTADDGTRYNVWGVAMTADQGATWSQPDMPDACGDGLSKIIGNQDRIVMVHGKGLSCVSTDGGLTFAAHQIDVDADTFGSAQGTPVYDGSKFWIWGRRKAYSSVDGEQWQSEDRDDLHLGATAYDPHHDAFVSIRGGWRNWYDKQEIYRSADGVQWEKLDSANYVPSHRIRHLAFGWAKSGTVCPAP